MRSSSTFAAALLLVGPAFATTTYPDCVNGPLASNLVCDTTAAPAARASALVAALQISEKLVNLVDKAPGAPRIGLPAYEWWSEALHGVAGSPGVNFSTAGDYSSATSFAMPITFSSAFDDDLVKQIATVISTEARAYANAGRAGIDFFTPNINPYRDPRWGRGSETPGEDPFRIKGYVNNLLQGLEGGVDLPKKKIVATCKHFAGYDLEDWDGQVRYGYNAIISSQDLAEYYLPPFQQCARDNKVGSFMCSYNAVNGVPSCSNSYLLEDILRDHWNWTNQNQYVTSDCNAVSNVYEDHKYVATNEEAVGVSFTAGTDNACEAGDIIDPIGAYNQSLLSVAVIDQALRRQYEALVRLGYFDPASDSPYRALTYKDVNTPQAQQLAVDSATKSIVLKKNNGLLPLNFASYKSVGVIGMWANSTSQMLGGYSGIPPYYHGPLVAAQQLGLKVNYATGPINESTTTGNWTDAAMAAAKASDLILYFGGIDNSVEAEAMDRYQIAWPASQVALIKQLGNLGKPLVVAQLGDQLDDTPLLNNRHVDAVLWAGFPGQSGGTAVFDILSGKVAPAGRLPVTQYPANYVNEVPFTDQSLRPSATNPGRTYRWFSQAVLPFGFGMHYTTFSTQIASPAAPYNIQQILSGCSEPFPDLCALPSTVDVTVKNTGRRASDYVTLLFGQTTAGPAPAPIKTLVAYGRLAGIKAGQSQTIKLTVKLAELARRDGQGNLILYPGKYNFMVDTDGAVAGAITLVGKQARLEDWPQPPANQTGYYPNA